MKRPNTKSPTAIIAGFITSFATLVMFTWVLTRVTSQIDQGQSQHLFTKEQFHNLQGISLVIGGMFGAFITSILSPRHEISRAIILGIVIIVFFALGTIRSYTQTFFDLTHLIVFIFTIPFTWMVAYFVKRIMGRRLTSNSS